MKSGKSRAIILGFPLFAVLGIASAAVAQHAAHAVPSIPQALLERPVTLRSGVGAMHDDAGTKSREAQRFYDQGLAYLHNYAWIEAARSFHQALKADPDLALAHVGLSYAYVELNKTAEAKQRVRETIPLGRLGQADDVIGAALYFASPAAEFVTGQTLIVDGGLSLP